MQFTHVILHGNWALMFFTLAEMYIHIVQGLNPVLYIITQLKNAPYEICPFYYKTEIHTLIQRV